MRGRGGAGGGCPNVNRELVPSVLKLERTWVLELRDSCPSSVTLKKKSLAVRAGKKIVVIILSTPRFDEKGNGGPERSGDMPESQKLVEGWGWRGTVKSRGLRGPAKTPQG